MYLVLLLLLVLKYYLISCARGDSVPSGRVSAARLSAGCCVTPRGGADPWPFRSVCGGAGPASLGSSSGETAGGGDALGAAAQARCPQARCPPVEQGCCVQACAEQGQGTALCALLQPWVPLIGSMLRDGRGITFLRNKNFK